MIPGIIEEAISAHGGRRLWDSIDAVDAVISVRGLLLTVKRRPLLDRVRVRARAHRADFIFFDFPEAGLNAELIGDDEVCIFERPGQVHGRRFFPRTGIRSFSRMFSWDDLDFTYFGGYAIWNYLVTPFLFLRDGFEFETLPRFRTSLGDWERVRVTFPPGIPTHCRSQVFSFDQDRLLRRLDYTAEVVGGWAHAAHICDEYQDFDGLKVATKRRVFPLFHMRNPLPGPVLVAIDVHDAKLCSWPEKR
ncbi:MAG: hypothetical protein OHK006_23200 [Thermodesulfovibrionales bacterium]